MTVDVKKQWMAYLTAVEALSLQGDVWNDEEQLAEGELKSRLQVLESENNRRVKDISMQRLQLQEILDEGQRHLRRVGLDSLLPKRVPPSAGERNLSTTSPLQVVRELDELSNAIAQHRRLLEQHRLERENAERRLKSEELEAAMRRQALRATLIKIGAVVVVCLVVLLVFGL